MKSIALYFSLAICTVSRLTAQVDFETSTLPIVIIETTGEIVDEPKVFSTMKIIDNGPGNINQTDDIPNDYDGFIGIELRGQTSQQLFEKKSYGVELKNANDEDTSAVVMGFPSEEDWVLHGPYSDKSLMRNYLTFKIWEKMGRYGSRVRFCELVINGDYKGVYVFMERIKRDGDRVDVSRLNPDENSGDDLTGGYIVKIDKVNPGEETRSWDSEIAPPNAFQPFQKITFFMDYPRPEEISDQQFDYIRAYVNAFEASIQSPDFDDPFTGYRALADVSSFIDYALLSEINRNVDSYRLSTFFHKDKDSGGGKLVMGPPWDYNLAFGNANYCSGADTEGWAWDFNNICSADFWLNPFWWNAFLRDAQYVSDLRARWEQLRNSDLSDQALNQMIDEALTLLDGPQQRNFERWPVLGEQIWPNSFVGSTFEEEVDYLRSWLMQRVDWMDNEIAQFEVVVGIEDEFDNSIRVFPNPFGSTLRISSKDPVRLVQVFHLDGRRALAKSFEIPAKQMELTMAHLPAGSYLIALELATGELHSRVVVK